MSSNVKEADIIINGHKLSFSEAMAVRVAMTSFQSTLQTEGLGDDELGKGICKGYIKNSTAVLEYIFEGIQ